MARPAATRDVDENRQAPGAASGSVVGLVDQLCAGGVTAHRIDAAQGARLGLVRLTHRDDLPVAGLEPEPVLALRVLVKLELARHREPPAPARPCPGCDQT